LPEKLLKRADVILTGLEAEGAVQPSVPAVPQSATQAPVEDSLFTSPVIDHLLSVDVTSMTPIEAISFLYTLQKEAKEGSGRN